MSNALHRKYHRSGRRVNGKVGPAKGKAAHLDMLDPIRRSNPQNQEIGVLLPNLELVDTLASDQLNMLAEYVQLIESKQVGKDQAQAPAKKPAASVTPKIEHAVDLSSVAEKLKQEEVANHRSTMLSGVMFAGSAGLLIAASASSLESVKSLATGYAIATATTALSAKMVDDSTEKNREKAKKSGLIAHTVGDVVLFSMIGKAVSGLISGMILTVAPGLGQDIADRITNVNVFTLANAAIHAKNYFFDQSGALKKFDGQLTVSFGNVVSRTLLAATIAQSAGLLSGFGAVGVAGYFVAFTLGRTLLDIYYDYGNEEAEALEAAKKAEEATKKADDADKDAIDKSSKDKDAVESSKKAKPPEKSEEAVKKPLISTSNKRLAKFMLKRLAINASVCAAGFISPYAASFASRTLPILSSTILSSSFVEGAYNAIKGININISKPVSDFFSKLFSEKGASAVVDKSMAAH